MRGSVNGDGWGYPVEREGFECSVQKDHLCSPPSNLVFMRLLPFFIHQWIIREPVLHSEKQRSQLPEAETLLPAAGSDR